jgi:hypothetical protein
MIKFLEFLLGHKRLMRGLSESLVGKDCFISFRGKIGRSKCLVVKFIACSYETWVELHDVLTGEWSVVRLQDIQSFEICQIQQSRLD